MPVCRSSRRRSFSYVEAVIALLILSVGMTAGLRLYGSFAQGSLVDSETAIARELAADLIAEIVAEQFEDPGLAPGSFGREAGESSRANFDDVDDYGGWTENPPADVQGNLLPGLPPGLARSVVVRNVSAANFATAAAAGSTAVKEITVTVTCNGRQRARLVAFRTRHHAND